MMIKFSNSYFEKLPKKFYQEIAPFKFEDPQLLCLNQDLARELDLDLEEKNLAEIFSGKKILSTSKPIALAYAGHQFGNFVPKLGDGRAILLGEIIAPGEKRYDLQLKGSGPTEFSRRGDGFATLGAAIREYLVSEAMHYLGIPTTRILAIVKTNSPVFREEISPGAVMTRIALSHVRVGTFEYFAAQGDFLAIKELANYSIWRHFPRCHADQNPYVSFFREVVTNQAKLIAKWLATGFIHGVMNTDNMTISGQTIDFGPCAFLDEYDENKVFSSIDSRGRYAYLNQSKIAKWNLSSLANCLAPICDDEKNLLEILENFDDQFKKYYHLEMTKKLGFSDSTDDYLIKDFLALMKKHQSDYTITFRKLSDALTQDINLFNDDRDFDLWQKKWRVALAKENKNFAEISATLNKTNPAIIARNHMVEAVIKSANDDDFSPLFDFISALKTPFLENKKYSSPPKDAEKITQTFCGT
jgi:uncharacterized protein YdiU (UPF0061 family)